MAEQERPFKGVWIPAEIWLNEELTMTDKCVLAEIDSFCSKNRSCYASNKHFADFIGVSENRISHIISNLIEKGYVNRKIIYKKGTKNIEKRLLSVTRGYCYPQQRGIVTDNKDTNTYTNTINIGGEAPKRTKKEFKPPTKEDIQSYITEKIEAGKSEYKNVDVNTFFDYYNEADWHMSNGRKIKSWKQCLITWASREWNKKQEQPKKEEVKRPVYADEIFTEEEMQIW